MACRCKRGAEESPFSNGKEPRRVYRRWRCPTPASPREGLLARHPLLFYTLLAYAGTWLVWLPFLLSADGLGLMSFSSPPPLIATGGLGSFTGPALGAFVIMGVTEGREGIGRLLQKIVLWRVGLRWYLFALVGLPAILALGTISAVPLVWTTLCAVPAACCLSSSSPPAASRCDFSSRRS